MAGTTLHSPRNFIAAVFCGFGLLLLLASQRSHACPFCLSPPQTMAEQMAAADITLIAKLVRFQVYDRGTRPESTLRIQDYLHGQHIAALRRELARGQSLVIPAEAAGAPGDLFLMFGQLPEGSLPALHQNVTDDSSAAGLEAANPLIHASKNSSHPAESITRISKTSLVIPELISWNETTAVSRDAVSYLQQIPPRSLDQPQRLAYFVKFLEHRDPLIAIDAWAEFGCSSYEDVVAVRHLLSREKLRAWIADPFMSPERLGLYGMMLGLCGTKEDAQFLNDQMQDEGSSAAALRFGSEGLMAGYLLLTGESGLHHLEDSFILSPDRSDTASHAFVQALQFMWSYERDRIPEDRIRQSMRLLLRSDAMREIAITNLARWEDWNTLPELMALFDRECAQDRAARRAILQFAQACINAGQGSEPKHEQTDAAAQFVERIRQTTPELLQSSLKDFTAPQ